MKLKLKKKESEMKKKNEIKKKKKLWIKKNWNGVSWTFLSGAGNTGVWKKSAAVSRIMITATIYANLKIFELAIGYGTNLQGFLSKLVR